MKLKDIIEKYGREPENLIQILLEYQAGKKDNFISEDEVKVLADEMNISESRIYGVITFYTLFSTKPRGKYIIQVCNDVPCHVNGSVDIIKEFEKKLKVKFGETTPDGIFTLEHTSCIGCCDMPPAIRIDGELYGNLTPDKISDIVNTYRRKYYECKEQCFV